MNAKNKNGKLGAGIPKPIGAKIPKISKMKYLSTHKSLKPTSGSRNRLGTQLSNHSNKREMYKVKSTTGDDSDPAIDPDTVSMCDGASVRSMFPDMTPTGMESLTNRSHANSVNGRTETGLTNISEGSELDLKDKNLSIVPKEMFTFKLKSINLANNNLAQFPDSLCECFNLKYLYLQNNKIRHIPSAIGKLTKLKFLCIHSNKLQEIPRELGECTHMSKLSLKDNEFSSLPSSLGNMQNLKVFEIEWFKYCIPAIRILGKDGKIKSESMQSCIKKFLKLCQIFYDYGIITLSVFISYFSTQANHNKGEELDFNVTDNRKRTILHRAATQGHIGVVKGLLCIENINPNLLEKDQCTPLGLALRDDHTQIAQLLIEKQKVNVDLGGGSFGAPIHIAVSKNKYAIIKSLVARGVDVNKVDFKTQTPLHIIMDVYGRDPVLAEKITRILVFNGADLNLLDLDALTPLHRVVLKKHIDGIKLIFQLNKELKARRMTPFDLNAPGGDKGYTALYFALEKKSPEIAENLFCRGAKACIRAYSHHYLPQHWKQYETNSRRHILWKMERFELDKRNCKIRMTEGDFNYPNKVMEIEGLDSCYKGYKTVGSYIRKYRHKKKALLKRRKEHLLKSNQKSQQKILFTINNPENKQGDCEVEDMNMDSDLDIEEEKFNHVSETNSRKYHGMKKQNMRKLNETEAMKVPKTFSVDNKSHCKGTNIFWVRDKILQGTSEPASSLSSMIKSLICNPPPSLNEHNFAQVLKDLAENLHKIGYAQILHRVINLIQLRGSPSLKTTLEKYILVSKPKARTVPESYTHTQNFKLTEQEYSQILLKECISTLAQKEIFADILKERRPYRQLLVEERKLGSKHQTRSANRMNGLPQAMANLSKDSFCGPQAKLARKNTDYNSDMKMRSGRTATPNIVKVAAVPNTIDKISSDSSERVPLGNARRGKNKPPPSISSFSKNKREKGSVPISKPPSKPNFVKDLMNDFDSDN